MFENAMKETKKKQEHLQIQLVDEAKPTGTVCRRCRCHFICLSF